MKKSNLLISMLKNILRRRIRYHQRQIKAFLHVSPILGMDIREKRIYYKILIKNIVKEIEEYKNDIIYESNINANILIKNYEIISFNGDWMGKVFTKNKHIYRGVYKESVDKFLKLWNSGILQILSKYGYIAETQITNMYSEDYPIILEHKNVEISTSKLWCSAMIAEACINMCVIRDVAKKFGYTLHDGHLNNITFHRGLPVFTDIGSFVEDVGQRDGFSCEIIFSGLYRLIFNRINNSILKRNQVFDEYNNAIWIEPRYYDDATYEYYKALKIYKKMYFFKSSLLCKWIIFKVFECYDVRPEYISLLFNYDLKTYSEKNYKLSKEYIVALKYINEIKSQIGSILDLDSTEGALIQNVCKSVPLTSIKVAMNNENKANIVYSRIKKKNLPVSVVLYNFMYGEDRGTSEYVKSDLVIALDIFRHIRCFQSYKYDSIIKSLAKISNKYILVSIKIDNNLNWIEIEKFTSVLSKTFRLIKKEIINNEKLECSVIYFAEKVI